MAKLIYATPTSLDGYIADETGSPDWARISQAADKIVYSKSLEIVSTPKTRLERELDPQVVRDLKAQLPYDVSVGGPTCGSGGTMKRVISAAFCLLVILSATALVFAKGATTKITITGAGLQSPVEISDPDVLKNFNIWSGPGTFANDVEGTEGFIVDWASGAVTDRPNGLRTFELSFYVRYANRPFSEQTDQLAYIVSYAVDPVSGQGYVYLPGKSDEPYRLNTKAIYRGREGNWFRANAAWQAAFRKVVHG